MRELPARSLDGRCVVAVHAHPDDESTKGAATMAALAARGARTVLIVCTDGAAGEIRDVAASDAGTLASVRGRELDASAAVLGYSAVHELGYSDSGMDAGVDGAFVAESLERVVDQLVDLMRVEQPDVVMTYDPGYAAGHPDHARCHEATLRAWTATSAFPGGPSKLYGTRTHSPARLRAMHEWLVDHGRESPYESAASNAVDDPMTTRVPVGEYLEVSRDALRCHRSQVAPDEPWFFAVPTSALLEVFPYEEFQLLASTVGYPPPGELEMDLFDRL